MTATDLRKATARHQRAKQRLDEAYAIKNQAVLEAVAAGWSYATVAEIADLTRGRIHQIVDEARRRNAAES